MSWFHYCIIPALFNELDQLQLLTGKNKWKQWNLYSQISALGLLDFIGRYQQTKSQISQAQSHTCLSDWKKKIMDWARTHFVYYWKQLGKKGNFHNSDSVARILTPWKELWSVLLIAFTCKKTYSSAPQNWLTPHNNFPDLTAAY